MTNRKDHTFSFQADVISSAAGRLADYHEERLTYWRAEYDKAVAVVKATAGVKIQEVQVTGGYRVDIVVDYGDPAAYRRFQEAYAKIQSHSDSAKRYRSDQVIYGTQGTKVYDLDASDVYFYELDGGEVSRPE